MPIPALNKSYKQRIPTTKSNEDATAPEVTGFPPEVQESRLRPPHTRTSSYQADGDASKRRSLLPQPGQARFNSQLDNANANAKPDSTVPQQQAPPRLRPRSMYQTATTQPVSSRSDEPTGVPRTIRPPTMTSKSTEPPAAGLSRSRSLRKPAPSSQPSQSRLTSTHSRTQSSSNASGLRNAVSQTGGSSTATRSMLVAPAAGALSKPSAVSSESTNVPQRSSARLAGLSRTTSIKSKSAEAPKEESAKTMRPAFSTLQQHFTPRKTAKAPTSTFLHPAPTTTTNALPPEIVNLQSELLQLHLLHTTSSEVSQQWHLSARRSLHAKFEEVASLHQAMLEVERAGREQKNLQALFAWSEGSSSNTLIEYIQILSGPLHELPSLLEPGGRFDRLVSDFDQWTTRMEDLWSERGTKNDRKGSLRSDEGLDESWKAEIATLARKVTSFARDLDQVRQPLPGSSIASILDTCKALLTGLSDELRLMQVIESSVAAKEKTWVEARLQSIARDVGSYSVESDDVVAAWRS